MIEGATSSGQAETQANLVAVHVVAGLTKSGGGTSYSVPSLAAALAPCLDVRIRTLEADPALQGLAGSSVELHTHPVEPGPLAGRLRSSHHLRRALEQDARSSAVFHVHGLWLMPNIYPAWIRRRSLGSRLIHSPRGMLGREALQISSWRKKVFWAIAQRAALAEADCFHATAMSEYEEIRAAGLRGPVAVIPNGIDPFPEREVSRPSGQLRTVLSLGRIHPKKGLDRLLRAWASLEDDFPSWQLKIVGSAEGNHDRQLQGLVRQLRLQRVTIGGPLYDEAKIAAYRAADLFVLPTLNENFGLTVAEALCAEIPVISTRGAPWSGLESEGCGWWIDHGVTPLGAALRTAMARPQDQLQQMGQRGRAWMIRDYGWGRIANDMFDVYQWLKRGGPPPGTVRLD